MSDLFAQPQGKYDIHGVVYDSDNLPMKNVAISSNDGSNMGCTDSLGQYDFSIDVLPITIDFKYQGCVTQSLFINNRNYESLPPIVMDNEVILDFFDERGSLKVSAPKLENYGDYADIMVGSVYWFEDSLPVVGAIVAELNKKGKTVYSVTTDREGNFYIPLKKLPTIVEIRYIGCVTARIRVTTKKVKKLHKFYLQEDHSGFQCD